MKKQIGAFRLAEMVANYEIVSAFLGWLESQGLGIIGEDDDLARRYAADSKTERAALDQILDEYPEE